MDLKGIRESTNFVDNSGAPWYSPSKLLTAVQIGMLRAIGSEKQKHLDEVQKSRDDNPIPHQKWSDIVNATVSGIKPDGTRVIQVPGQFDQVVHSSQPAQKPADYGDPNISAIMEVLHKTMKKK